MQFGQLKRREFFKLIGGAAAAWPVVARAQQPGVPVIGYLNGGSPEAFAPLVTALRKGLSETGFVEGRNVAIEYRWGYDQYDRLPALAAELARRQVAVIVAVGNAEVVLAAKTATATIPIVFAGGIDPIGSGLVASLNRPGGNATGITGMAAQIVGKQLGLLRELVPGSARIGALVNPTSRQAASIIADANSGASAIGLQIEILEATSSRDIEAAFASLVQKQIAALLVTADSSFISRRVHLAILAAKHNVPVISPFREDVQAGGLMSYGPSITDTNRQVGIYTGRILKGEKPGDLPVMQASKFEFVINLLTAKVLGLEIPPMLLARADEVIE
jgi:putative ABC transport system substrate-binding protein